MLDMNSGLVGESRVREYFLTLESTLRYIKLYETDTDGFTSQVH